MRRAAAAALFIVGVLAFRVTAAQEAGSVAGVVTSASGAALPGVTVRVASVELFEKVRTTITDAGGRYRVVNLPAGAYTITFSLAGFSPVLKMGVQVPAGSTTAVDAEMNIGSPPDSASANAGPRALGSTLSAQLRPYVRCGLTIVPADPKVDSKIRVPFGRSPNGLAGGSGPRHTMRAIAPTVCGDK